MKITTVLTLMLMTMLCCLPFTVSAASTGSVRILNQGDSPTKPTYVSGKVKTSANNKKYVYLTWGDSIDKCSGIKEYKIYRNGALVGTAINRYYSDYKVDDKGSYIYKVVAVDYKNHVSKPGQSQLITLNNNSQKKFINAHTKKVTFFNQEIPKFTAKTISYEPFRINNIINNTNNTLKNISNTFNLSLTKKNPKQTLSTGAKIKSLVYSICGFNNKSSDENLVDAVNWAIKSRGLKTP